MWRSLLKNSKGTGMATGKHYTSEEIMMINLPNLQIDRSLMSAAFHSSHFVPRLLASLPRSHILCLCPAFPTWKCPSKIHNAAQKWACWHKRNKRKKPLGTGILCPIKCLCDCGSVQCWHLPITCYRWNVFLILSKNYTIVTAYHTVFVLRFQKENCLDS